MKFRLLRCFAVAFVCVIETCGFSVWAEDTVVCDAGQYLDGEECKDCPIDDVIGEDKLYQFGDSGIGIESCTVKLNLAKSNCAEGTNVVYRYVSGGYTLDSDNNYSVNPKKGFYGNGTSGLNDHCTACPTNAAIGEDKLYQFGDSGIGIESCTVKLNLAKSNCAEGTNVVYRYVSGGYTLDRDNNYSVNPKKGFYGNGTSGLDDHCTACPTDEENIGEGKRFQFFKKEGVKCAIKLNPDMDNCDSSTNVVYESDGAGSAYRRKEANVVPKATSVISNPLPAVNDISSPFCNECTAGYYLAGDVCKKCPAGYYCPGKTEDDDKSQKAIPCPANTYSEDEAKGECSKCKGGYSTEWSTLVNKGLQTECSDVSEGFGIGCRSSKVCILSVMSKLSLKDQSGFTFGPNIKVETLNQSVVQSINNNN